MHKSGFISIIGRPNVGKSTLMNYIMKEKLSIVSNKPQTTRNNIHTILNGEDYQLIFVDTPGVQKPRNKLGEYMQKSTNESMQDVDLIVFVTTPDINMGKGDEMILSQLEGVKTPVFMVLNKIDEVETDRVFKTLNNFSKKFPFKEIIPISAAKGKNVDELLKLMVENMPEGPKYYPEDMLTDVQERFVASEIIREKALRFLSEEVPHGIAVEITSMKEPKGENICNIEANLYCEKASHKGIIIGKDGSMLKKITKYAKMDIEKMLKEKTNVKIWVKVKKEWRDNPFLLKELGYKNNKKDN